MPDLEEPAGERVRTAEIVATLCLATDLGMGVPLEHGLHGTLAAARLAERLGVDEAAASATYYAALLAHSGCTVDAEINAEVFQGGLTNHLGPVVFGSNRELVSGVVRAIPNNNGPAPRRAMQVARHLPRALRETKPHLTAICEVGEMLAERLDLPPSVRRLFVHFTERWDGKSRLGRAEGDAVALPMRISHVAQDATFQTMLHGPDRAVEIIRKRSGHAFDPDVVDCLVDHAGEILAIDAETSAWDATLAAEPGPHLVMKGQAVDRALATMGDFSDLIAPCLAGHSTGVATLAATAAQQAGLSADDVQIVKRAGYLHDLGRVAVAPHTWNKPGPLNVDEREQVRLHAYHTERILAPSSFLAPYVPVACAHHERLDSSGYHRGTTAAGLDPLARLLATADVYHAMTEPRPHRNPIPTDEVCDELSRQVGAGRLDADAVAAVLEAAGQKVPPLERPAGLTERESQVIALLARGNQTKQIGRTLGISTKTADRHIQHAYGKMGVSTRAAAALFAMEHGLVTWGELPTSR